MKVLDIILKEVRPLSEWEWGAGEKEKELKECWCTWPYEVQSRSATWLLPFDSTAVSALARVQTNTLCFYTHASECRCTLMNIIEQVVEPKEALCFGALTLLSDTRSQSSAR